jgi:hypothetical protein
MNQFKYLNFKYPHTKSTAVPKLPISELRDTFTNNEQLPPLSARMKLHSSNFYSTDVSPGDTMVLRSHVPHYGVNNPHEHDRYVLFVLFYPNHLSPVKSDTQRYPLGVGLK